MAAATEQQRATQRVASLVRDLRTEYELLELLAVFVKFFLIELVLQEFGDDLGLSNAP
jgi:hypothetical protein